MLTLLPMPLCGDALHAAAMPFASRDVQVQYFKHNDMEDLERMLKLVARDDRRLGRDVTKQRRFIVTEALFRSDG